MKIYEELADWWPLLSSPDDYAEEAEFYRKVLDESCTPAPRTVLELGSGGGNNASHLRDHYAMTLVDKSARMLEVSRALNPACEHVEGDMRTVRLNRTFDAVFVHDAIMYMTTLADLRAAIRTAFEHCRAGGVALFVPDYVRETFIAETSHGGHDRDGRGLRYLEWTYDPNPDDAVYVTDYVLMLRERGGEIRIVYDRHLEGLFARDEWLRLMRESGFAPSVIRDRWGRDAFLARRA